MYPRTNYEMTEADLKALLETCRPTIVMQIGGTVGSSPQENANAAWQALGIKMGFDYLTVSPIDGKGMRFFSAVPLESEVSRGERLEREAREKKAARVEEVRTKIKALKIELGTLLDS